MKTDLIKDLSIITTINESTLEKLNKKAVWCICDNLEKTIYNKEDISEIDIGIGNLLISLENNNVKYKFIPSKDFENQIVDTIVNEKNNLVNSLEETLVDKISNVYKNLL